MEFFDSSSKLGELLNKHGFELVTAESCTGGLLSAAITDVPGSSNYFDRGFVTYGNLAKEELLQVDVATLDLNGAVSEEVAREMACGALENSEANVAMVVTGIAGPTGGTEDKPVGTVCFAWGLLADDGAASPLLKSSCKRFGGTRQEVRAKSVQFVLDEMIAILGSIKK